jgi:flagellar hook-basal body complex protein FliE
MSIDPIAATAAITPVMPIRPSLPTAPIAGAQDSSGTAAAAAGGSSASFGQMLSTSLQNLQATQNKADNLAVSAATGDLTDVHDYMIAAVQADLATQLTVQVRDKALDAFNEIMRMQA